VVLLPNEQFQAPHHVTVDLGQLTGGTGPPKVRAPAPHDGVQLFDDVLDWTVVTSLTLARIDFIARWLGQHLATQRRRFRHEGR